MAKVITGPSVSEIRGTCGEVCYSRNRGGMYQKKKYVRIAAWSTAQNDFRTYSHDVTVRWNANLTDTQRTAWSAAAGELQLRDSLKQKVELTGQQYYIALNAPLYWCGGSIIDDPPPESTVNAPPILSILTATASPPQLVIKFDRACDADEFFYLQSTKCIKPTINFFTDKWAFLYSIDDTLAPPLDAQTQFSVYHGALVAGQKIAFKIRAMNKITGKLSGPIQATTLIGTQIPVNGDFETGNPGNPPTGWTDSGTSPGRLATDQVKAGAQSLKLTHATPLSGFNWQGFTNPGLNTYVLSAWIKTLGVPNNPGPQGANVAVLDIAGTQTYTYLESINRVPDVIPRLGFTQDGIDHDWTFCYAKFVTAGTPTPLQVYALLGGSDACQGTAWFDNVTFYKVPT